LKQAQQSELVRSADTGKKYEWSYMRVVEGFAINVVSAVIIGGLAILSGVVYAGWTLLLREASASY
jgi:hypothetical protein